MILLQNNEGSASNWNHPVKKATMWVSPEIASGGIPLLLFSMTHGSQNAVLQEGLTRGRVKDLIAVAERFLKDTE